MHFDLEPRVDLAGSIFDESVRALESNKPFVYAKLNHGFWERLVRIERLGYDIDAIGEAEAGEIERRLNIAGSAFVETGFLAELFALLTSLPAPSEGFHFAATVAPWPHSYEIEGTPLENRAACLKAIKARVPLAHLDDAQRKGMTGHEFKAALIVGRFHEFSRPLAASPFLLIANPAMAEFPAFVGAREVDHLQIDARNARRDRHDILNETLRRVARQRGVPRVIVQAGGALSTWLCHHLFRARPDTQIFDIGNATSICNPEVARRQNWVRVYSRSLLKGAEKVHPGWLRPTAATIGQRKTAEHCCTGGNSSMAGLLRHPELVALASERGVPPPNISESTGVPVAFPEKPISFIENKSPDWNRVQQFLRLSIEANHHANGGPVSRLLEDAVACLLKLPSERKVVACSSATSGIFLATSLLAYRAGKRSLRWVTSAYGFFSCNVGPLADTRILDGDENGRFSLETLRGIPMDSWDGVIFTNLFAQHSDWQDVRDFCLRHGKHFIVDNAVGLLDRPAASPAPQEIEAISCHHTKPWGNGEGGLLIVDQADEAEIRSLTNFGARMPPQAHPHASNAKLSDLAAAGILDRLERIVQWSTFYRMQERRILSVIEDFDIPLRPLPGQTKAVSPRSHLPLIAPNAAHTEKLTNPYVVLRKYYRPLVATPQPASAAMARIGGSDSTSNSLINASSLYERIVCCPSNPELRLLGSERLAAVLGETLS
jgi:dTDP-4-amino-4,6-dideoxygalactose transaminase